MHVCVFMHMHVGGGMCVYLQDSAKGRGYQTSWSWNYPGGKLSDRMLGTKDRSSTRAASTHNHRVSLLPQTCFASHPFEFPFILPLCYFHK